MQRFYSAVLACLCLAAVAGCSRHVPPPVGRWEGTYDSGSTIVAARMEVTPKEQIYVSAPNAENIGSMSAEDHAAVRQARQQGVIDARVAVGVDGGDALGRRVPWHQLDAALGHPVHVARHRQVGQHHGHSGHAVTSRFANSGINRNDARLRHTHSTGPMRKYAR